MTWSKFHKNCIVTGLLDGYCLVCNDHMKSEDDYNLHINKPVHQKNLEATPYFEKFKQEHIRKVKKGYYCEICNMLFFTAAKVGLHIAEAQHNSNRGIHLLRRTGQNKIVVAYENVYIGTDAWNGFVDDTCVICNKECDDLSIHQTEQDHILNLIQKNVEFGDEDFVYRKIDESSFQCLTCNMVLALDTVSTHFKEEGHKSELENKISLGRLQIVEDDIEKKIPSAIQTNATLPKPATDTQVTSKNETTTDKVKAPTKNKENVNENVKQGNKKQKNKSADEIPSKKSVTAKSDAMKNAIEMDKYICDVLKARNYVSETPDGLSTCFICDWSMDRMAVGMHLSGRHHQTMLKMHKDRLERLSKDEKEPVQVNEDELDDLSPDDDRSKIMDALPEFQSNNINVNFEMSVASCKKCSKSFNLDYDVLKNHIEEHKKKSNKKETKQVPLQSAPSGNKKKENGTTLYTKPVLMKEEGRSKASSVGSENEEIKNFAKKNNMTYANNKVICELCDQKMTASMNCLKKHVEGAGHQKNVKNVTLSLTPVKSVDVKKVPTNVFIQSLARIENVIHHSIVINDKYLINVLSFMMISLRTNGGNNVLKCEACQVEMRSLDNMEIHKVSDSHMKAMNNTMVLISDSLENEFIRELRADVYHCGYCSKAVEGWEGLMAHTTSTDHRESKNVATWRLLEHAPELGRLRWQEAMEKNLLGFMMNHFMRGNYSDSD